MKLNHTSGSTATAFPPLRGSKPARVPGVRQIMSDQSEPLFIDCGEHGQRISAVVCRHLVNASGERVGFIENCSDPHDLQAWCHKCEIFFEEEDGMSEKFREFNDMALVCVVCYEKSREYHSARN